MSVQVWLGRVDLGQGLWPALSPRHCSAAGLGGHPASPEVPGYRVLSAGSGTPELASTAWT